MIIFQKITLIIMIMIIDDYYYSKYHLDICVIDPDQFISGFKGSFFRSWGVVKHLQNMIDSEHNAWTATSLDINAVLV